MLGDHHTDGNSCQRTNGHDTQTPDVNLRSVLFPRNDLRCHPVWRADHGRALGVGLGYLRAETEVGCEIKSKYCSTA